MKLIILKNNLKNGLDLASFAIGRNSNLPAISNVLIKTDENKVRILSTNLEIGITATVSGKIIEDGSVCVPHEVISNIINNISSERVSLEAKNNNLNITTDNYEALIQGLPESDFPIMPKIKNLQDPIEVESEELSTALSRVIVAAGSSELRPEINGVLFSLDSTELKVAATDSFRLAEAKVSSGKYKNKLNEAVKAILPLRTSEILIKVSRDLSDSKINMFFDANQVFIKTDSAEIISRVIEGKFPDYEPIIPKETAIEALISREEFMSALRLASSFAAKIKDVKLKISDGKLLEVYSSDSSLGENKYLIPGKIKGGDVSVSFNLKYLLDAVKVEDTDQIFIGLNEDNRPAVFKTPGTLGYFYILMPVKA